MEPSARAIILFLVALGGVSTPASAEAPAEVVPPENSRIEALVRNLGATAWEAREAALDELVEIGEPAVALLTQATSSPDLEVVWRADLALRRISLECTVESLLREDRWEVQFGQMVADRGSSRWRPTAGRGRCAHGDP
jgi:HEAT repeat protein